jgi:tetratricopeptide (TPR) repeat protein
VTDHPTPDDLEGLARGALARLPARKVFGHLLECRECRGAAGAAVPFLTGAPSSAAALRPAQAIQAAASSNGSRPALAAFVDHALPQAPSPVMEVARATHAVALLREGGLPALAASPGLTPLTACMALVRHCRELRYGEPAVLVEAALWAALAAEALATSRYGAEFVADVQARAWAELGNAYRIANDLAAAEQALAKAAALARRGTGAPVLRALLLEFRGSVFGCLRRFTEAFGTLDAAREIYAQEGEGHQAGRILITKGLYATYANEFERAITLLDQGLAQVEERRDPRLVLAASHNTANALAELGRLSEARALLARNRERYERHGGRMDVLRRTWLEGTIAAGLGELDEAERCLVEVRGAFKRFEVPYELSLVSLDLAAVWLRQGRTQPARQLVEDAAAIFRHLGITREALAAVLVLQRAFELEAASVALLEPVAALLRRLARDPAARFEPGGA